MSIVSFGGWKTIRRVSRGSTEFFTRFYEAFMVPGEVMDGVMVFRILT